jgi:hypothetical protein
MLIPMSANELMRIQCDKEELDLLVVPKTGDNDYAFQDLGLMYAGKDDKKSQRAFLDAFVNLFVKGYVLHDEKRTRYLFKKEEKASDFLNANQKNWLASNILNLNELNLDQKKT